MSIKAKLATACLFLLLVNLSVGAFSHLAQQRMAALGFDIYDRAFMAMSYLRSSQNGLAALHAAADRTGPGDRAADTLLQNARDDVEVARKRAMSEEGAAAAQAIGRRLERLQSDLRANGLASMQAEVGQILDAFDTTVEIYAGDGYLYRQKLQSLVDVSLRDAGIAVAASAAVALTIMLVLWRSMMPPLRSAVRIAQSISAGKLDNVFPARGSDEMAILLRTMSGMQDSLVEKIARIDALAAEARARAGELQGETRRFAAALDNMCHGLCMVDAANRIIVTNQRLSEIFGAPPPIGADLLAWPPFAELRHSLAGGVPNTEQLSDGRIIRINGQPVVGGGQVFAFEDITEQRRAEQKLSRMAHYDALTELPNRVLFYDTLERLVRTASAASGPTVLYIDLDGFKTVNDTLGHGMGDELLRAVAGRLRRCTGPSEIIARLGGDEFAVILRTGDERSAERLAVEILEALREPFDIPPHRVFVGASIGAAMRHQAEGASAEFCTTLLKNADMALYRAKADGRNAYMLHSDALDTAMLDRRHLEADLRTALERDEFALDFQPIVRASDSGLIGFEALIRWNHPSRGSVPPTTFIPLAEKAGLITAIGRWVLRAACAEASRWPADLKVAVNLSPVQFRQGFLGADIVRAIADTGLTPRRLELEITESVLIEDSASVIAVLTQIRALGVRVALDDFGTGYSSLSYLRKFPFDKLKIDKSFVQDLSNGDGINLAILRAITSLARALNLPVVAEGIETADQARLLRAEGCSELQGYYFGYPAPARGIGHAPETSIDGIKGAARMRV